MTCELDGRNSKETSRTNEKELRETLRTLIKFLAKIQN